MRCGLLGPQLMVLEEEKLAGRTPGEMRSGATLAAVGDSKSK
jgi:hypothetical protein